MIILTDKLGFRSRPFRMFRSDFMYTIGQVSQMCGIPVSTLRYYDKEGLFPHMERVSGIRRFSDRELETLRIIDCLKKSGRLFGSISLILSSLPSAMAVS